MKCNWQDIFLIWYCKLTLVFTTCNPSLKRAKEMYGEKSRIFHCFSLSKKTFMVTGYTYGFSAVLLSQNGFFTDKGRRCAVKCCCAITGWGSLTRGWGRERVKSSVDVFLVIQLLHWPTAGMILLEWMYVKQEVNTKKSSRQCVGETFIRWRAIQDVSCWADSPWQRQ